MTALSQFNSTIHDFVSDLKTMSIDKGDINKLETYIEITRVNARTIISNFQKYALRDVFVQNIVRNNADFFVNYDPSGDVGDSTIALTLIGRIQGIVRMMMTKGDVQNVDKIFRWLKILVFHAYTDLGMDAGIKLKTLM